MSGEEKKQPCPICFEESDAQRMASKDEVGPEWFFECPRCGDFIITFMAKEIAEDQDGDLERLFCLEKKEVEKGLIYLPGCARETKKLSKLTQEESPFY